MAYIKTILAMAALVAALVPQAANAQGATCDKDTLKPRRETFTLPPYPDAAKEKREQGTTVLRLVIGKTGQAISAKVETSSGSASLDQRAVEWVTEIFRWDIVKPECQSAETQLRIVWNLKNAEGASDADVAKARETEQKVLDIMTRAHEAEEKGALDTAMDLYNQALDLLPTAVIALHNRGWVYERKKDYAHALADYDKAIQLAPDVSQLYVRRCAYYVERKDATRALPDCDKGIELDASNAFAHHTRGLAYALKQDAVSALRDFSEAIRLKPNAAASYYERARVYSYQRKAELAFQDIEMAARINPPWGNIFAARGAIQNMRGNYSEAIADLGKALDMGVTDEMKITAFVSRADAYLMKKDYPRAIAGFGSALAVAPQMPGALNGRCWTRALANIELDIALADCNTALSAAPKTVATLDSRGFVYFRMGDMDKAIADYDAALALEPKTASTLYKRGIAKSRKGDTAGGKADMDAALALDSKAGDQMRDIGIRP